MTATDDLPDDVPTLKATVASQRAEIARQRAEIAHLNLWVAKLRRHRFGRRSERAGALLDQLELQLEDLEAGAAELDARTGPAGSGPTPSTPAPAPVSRALPAHLPRDVCLHQPDAVVCPDCGGPLQPLGEGVSEVLEYVPSHFRAIRHVRSKRAVDHLRKQGIEPGPTDLAHLSPLDWAHITLTGDYHWEVEPSMGPDPFRPLRTTDFAMAA